MSVPIFSRMPSERIGPDMRIALALIATIAPSGPAAGHRAPALNITATTLDGKPFDTRTLHGQVVIVNFWATWCAPCRAELPEFDRWYRANRGQGVMVLAISADDDSKAKAVRSIAAGFAFPVALASTTRVSGVARASQLPVTLIFDRSGTLRFDSRTGPPGLFDQAALNRIVGPLLRERPAS